MNDEISISICVPAFDEEESLPGAIEDLLETLRPRVRELEIIIVDDGSSDSTPSLADRIAREEARVRVVHHAANSGIGACYRSALKVAGGDFFTWFPSDHENSAGEFIECLKHLKPDTVVTCHHLGRDPRPALRRWISRSYTWILNRCFHLDLKYYNGMTIFPTGAVRAIALVSDGFALSAESLIKAIRTGYCVVELSAPLNQRRAGKQTALSIMSFYRMTRDLLKIIGSAGGKDAPSAP